MDGNFKIVEIDLNNASQFAHLVCEFWPNEMTFEQELQAAEVIIASARQQAFLVKVENKYVGFIHVAIRHEFVEGKTTPFVGFIEGIYLQKPYQGQGIGTSLVKKGEDWARAKGCTQMGSDTEIKNENSIGFHKHLGYKELNRCVAFMKDL